MSDYDSIFGGLPAWESANWKLWKRSWEAQLKLIDVTLQRNLKKLAQEQDSIPPWRK